VGFVVEKVMLGQVPLRAILFSLVNIIPPLLYVYSYISWRKDKGPVRGPVSEKESRSTTAVTMHWTQILVGPCVGV
jgi:hypothetical protein